METFEEDLEKLNKFLEIEDEIGELLKIYKADWGSIKPTLEKVGKWKYYEQLHHNQDIILSELNLKREWEDFGNETFLHIDTLIHYIKGKLK